MCVKQCTVVLRQLRLRTCRAKEVKCKAAAAGFVPLSLRYAAPVLANRCGRQHRSAYLLLPSSLHTRLLLRLLRRELLLQPAPFRSHASAPVREAHQTS